MVKGVYNSIAVEITVLSNKLTNGRRHEDHKFEQTIGGYVWTISGSANSDSTFAVVTSKWTMAGGHQFDSIAKTICLLLGLLRLSVREPNIELLILSN